MGRRDKGEGGRFGRAAHTTHGPRDQTPPSSDWNPNPPPPRSGNPNEPMPTESLSYPPPRPAPDAYGPTSYIPMSRPSSGDTRALPPVADDPPGPPPVQYGPPPVPSDPPADPPAGRPSDAGTSPPTESSQPTQPPATHPPPNDPLPTQPAKVTVTRAVAHRGRQAAQNVTRRVVAASQADGAQESGLTALIWNQVLSYGSDAMVTVALAGTVFFSAAHSEQKGNVLGYLLITMAPFAIVAPVIGPVLDRLQHGRRWAMAATSFGRALLAILMAQNFRNLLLLFPLALGSLVLSKAYSVVRAAAAPRVVPTEMTLVTANARLSIFGLCSAIIGGGFVAAVIKVTHSYSLGLWVAAIAFGVTGYFSLRLPGQVDSAHPSTRHPDEPPRPERVGKVPALTRIRTWVSRGFDPQVIIAMQGASLLRWASGFLTLFLAFYIEHTSHGFDAVLRLGAVGAGVGIGNFVGTAAGARFKLAHPEKLVMGCTALAAGMCVFAAITFSVTTATICIASCSAANALGKLSLDAVVQRDVNEMLRSSAFARSETFLQLAWVFGAAVALLLPSNRGTLGLSVAASFLAVLTVVIVLHSRALTKAGHPGGEPEPGTV